MRLFNRKSEQDLIFSSTLKGLIHKKPKNLELYKLAFRHTSVAGDSNERLEYLGDAILGAIVAEYLFKKFPYKDEGFLTEVRSRIVKRESLNGIAMRMGFKNLIEYDNRSTSSISSMLGNALEAFVGAIYLDCGYKFTKKYIINTMIADYVDLNDIVKNDTNFKSTVIEWAQKNQKKLSFETINVEGDHHRKVYTVALILDNEEIAQGSNSNKKKAEQAAAKKAIGILL